MMEWDGKVLLRNLIGIRSCADMVCMSIFIFFEMTVAPIRYALKN